MYCASCGSEIPDGVRYCPECGLKIGEEPVDISADGNIAAEQPEKPLKKTTAIVLASVFGIVFLALIAAVVIINSRSPYSSLFEFQKGEILVIEGEKGLAVLNTDGGSAVIDLSDCDTFEYDFMPDITHTKAAIYVTKHTGIGYGSKTYYLYFFDGKKLKEIYSGSSELTDAYISDNAKTIAFTTGAGLNYYSKGEIKTFWGGKNVALSPDGIMAYSTGNGWSMKGYYFDGKEEAYLNNYIPFAISSGAKYIYLLKSGNTKGTYFDCCVKTKGEEGLKDLARISNINDVSGIYFNTDYSQLLMTGYSGAFYSENGGEARKISNYTCYPIFYEKTASEETDPYFNRRCKDLKSIYYLAKYSENGYYKCRIIKITDNGVETVIDDLKVDFSEDSCHMTDDGKKIWYCSNDKIYTIDVNDKDPEPKMQFELKNASKWIVSGDAKKLYFCDNARNVYVQKAGDLYPFRVFENDGTGKNYFKMSTFKGKLFFVSGGKLYSTNGGNASKVSGTPEGITDLYCGRYMLLLTTSEGDIFISTDGGRFTKITD